MELAPPAQGSVSMGGQLAGCDNCRTSLPQSDDRGRVERLMLKISPLARPHFDPITLEILWSQLIAAADEQAVTIHRTAFSTVVRESYDFSCVILNRSGDLLAQPYHTMPPFTRCASVVVKHFLSKWPDWHPDDVAITNDPWLATGHLHDVSIAVPIFFRDQLVGFSANIAHQVDIGGRGYSADASSIFEEGLALPPMKLYRQGRPVNEVFDIIKENVRVPDQVVADINVQVTAAQRGAGGVVELLLQSGIANLDAISDQILSTSEAAMADAIRRLPLGVYENEGILDGFDEPLHIKVKMTVKNGEIEYDFAGTSPQVGKGINCCYNFTYSYAAYATKTALEPLVPNNEGCYNPIKLFAPDASVINSRRPAPGNSRGRVGQMIVPVVFGALAKALPEVIPAEAGSPAPRANFFGTRNDQSEYQALILTCGGLGAQPGQDGVSCKAFPNNTTTGSLEVIETCVPLRFLKRELRPDSGGVGKYRGGLGQEIRVQVLSPRASFVSTSAERIDHPPRGACGGLPGKPAVLCRHVGERLAPKARTQIASGEIITIATPGGGGYGPADERDVDAIVSDLRLGYVTAAEVEQSYPAQSPQAQRRLRAENEQFGKDRQHEVSYQPSAALLIQTRVDSDDAQVVGAGSAPYRLGVDIGGTFTDFVLINTESGQVSRAKTLTTPNDPVEGIINGIRHFASTLKTDTSLIARVVHGTTLVANTIIERKGARTGLITTEGFQDILEIGNDTRYDIYDLQISFPAPLVPRQLRAGLPERMSVDGETLQRPDLDRLRQLVEELMSQGVTSVAVSFLHAYRNPSHEREVRAYMQREFPMLDVCISSEVAPEIREYERTSTVAANAYVLPIMRSYLTRIGKSLAEEGLRAGLFVMLSNGGVTSASSASKAPIRLVESGPAGGVLAACHAARAVSQEDVIAFDMGGTTAKICFVTRGRAPYTGCIEVARTKRQFRGSGIPTMVPSIEMVEIGAGGGSVASIGRTGVLKVGPESAGAMPGPACYARGGTAPTVTDADLVLGYIDPGSFLGGDMPLNRDKATEAMGTLAKRLGLPVERAALGVLQVVNHSMATAVRTHAAERGLDYRHYAIVASGGAGPVHVYDLARLLTLKTVVCPVGAGTHSALGFLVAPVAVDLARSYSARLASIDWVLLNSLYEEMEKEARDTMHVAGVRQPRVERMAELRFVGQGFEVTAEVPPGALTQTHAPRVHEAFTRAYFDLYGTSPGDLPVEALTWRLRASSDGLPASFRLVERAVSGEPIKGRRSAYFPELGRFEEVLVYDRYALTPGTSIRGPVLIEERESTLVVGPGGMITVADSLDLVVRLQ